MATVVETTRRDSSAEVSALVNGAAQTYVGRMVRQFKVTGTSNNSTALTEAGIPQVGDPHPLDGTLLANNIRASAIEERADTFTIDIEYSRSGLASGSTNPLLEPPLINWSSQLIEEPTSFDINDKQIATTAGEVFDSTVARAFAIVNASYSNNVAGFSANLIFTHVGRINAAVWNTTSFGSVPPQCAMLRGLSAAMTWSGDLMFFRRTMEFAFRSQLDKNNVEKGWKLRVINAGYMFKNAANELENIKLNAKGDYPRMPMLIKADGSGPEPNQATATATVREFDIYRTADFTALGVI